MDLQPAPSGFHAAEPLPDAAFACVAGEDWERAMLARQVWITAQLVEDCFAVSRALKQEITGEAPPAADDPPLVQGDPGLAHHRAQRAVRLAMALQTKTIDTLRRYDSDAKIDAGTRAFFAARETKPSRPGTHVHPRMARAQTIIEGIAEGQHDDAETVDALVDAACLRMRDTDNFGPMLDRPVSEIVAYLCGEIGLSPDWPRLAEQAWARAEKRDGKVGAPLASFTFPASGGGESRLSRETEGALAPKPEPEQEPAATSEQERPFRLDASRRSSFPAGGQAEEAAAPQRLPTDGLPGELPPRRPPRPPRHHLHMTRP